MENFRPEASPDFVWTQIEAYIDYIGEAVLRNLKLSSEIYDDLELFKTIVLEERRVLDTSDPNFDRANRIIGTITGIQSYMGAR